MIMKIFNLLLLSGLLLCISSCQQEEIYSCDEEVNDWVNKNLGEIRVMTRSEWRDLGEDVKRGCYVAFTQQQKVDFWIGKFDEALALDWTLEEAEHIKLMRNFVNEHPEYFDNSREKTDEEIEIFEIFIYEWMKKAEQELQWSRKTIGGLIASGNTLISKDGTVQTNSTNLMTKSAGESKCHCSSKSNWCSIDITVDCVKGGCEEVNGCGTLWANPCDGRCNGI